jgi:hypothetical protein
VLIHTVTDESDVYAGWRQQHGQCVDGRKLHVDRYGRNIVADDQQRQQPHRSGECRNYSRHEHDNTIENRDVDDRRQEFRGNATSGNL